jgi:hypothetical protein
MVFTRRKLIEILFYSLLINKKNVILGEEDYKLFPNIIGQVIPNRLNAIEEDCT